MIFKLAAWAAAFMFVFWCIKVVDAIDKCRGIPSVEVFVINRNDVISRKWRVVSGDLLQMDGSIGIMMGRAAGAGGAAGIPAGMA